MELLTLLCLLIALPKCLLCYTNTQDGSTDHVVPGLDFNARLTKIEALLEASLRKNAELENRMEVLEDENKQLKTSVRDLQTERDASGRHAADSDEVNTGSHAESTALRNVKDRKRSAKVPRIVLALTEGATVAFTAAVASEKIEHLGKNQAIIYDRVITNLGGGYHNTSGIFLAPVSGVYVFNWNTMTEPGDREYLELVKNGQWILSNYAHGTGENRYESSSMTTTLEVKQGEEVWVRAAGITGTVHGNSFTTFSGWLLAYTE